MLKLISTFLSNKYLAIFWTVLLFILCTIPSEQAARIGSANDKINHLIAFLVFTFLWLFHTSMAKLMVFIGILYGIGIEVWQYYLPESFNRGFEWLDTLADAIGCVIGYIIWKLFQYVWLKAENKKPKTI